MMADKLSPLDLANSLRGIAPYGFRHIESASELAMPKGTGYFGSLPNQAGGVSTEISASNDMGSFPLLVPNLTAQEINHLLANKEPTDAIYKKAEDWAKSRIAQGQSPFAQSIGELKWPKP